jgi:hypothetical protein
MKREPRNPEIKFKPAVVSWFKSSPEAKSYFDPVKDFLVSYYSGLNYGFINKKAYPEYRFNSVRNSEISVVIRASQSHTRVRIRIDCSKVNVEFNDYYKTIANRYGERTDVFDFMVSKTSDIKIINNFFRKHDIHNFTVPKASAWKKFEINSSDTYKSIRLQSGEEVVVSNGHLKLSNKFIKWLTRQGYKNIKSEYILANHDRIDVLFNLNNKIIFSELKTVSGSSAKRAIREALGQILDYQYYDQVVKASELWIVVNDECSDNDVLFIKTLIDKHKLPLRLVWEKNRGFLSFPKL